MMSIFRLPVRELQNEFGSIKKGRGLENETERVPYEFPGRTTLFCEVESFPDFLQDHRLLDKEPLERLKEHCRKWTAFVTSLEFPDRYDTIWRLCFRYEPDDGRFYIAFIGSLDFNVRDGEEILRGTRRSLESLGVKLHEMTPERKQWWFDKWRPGKSWKHICALEQRDQLAHTRKEVEFETSRDNMPIRYKLKTHYQVEPIWGPGGAFIQPFETAFNAKIPCEIGVTLKATRITDDERLFLENYCGDAATRLGIAQSTIDEKIQTKPSPDPSVEWAVRVWSANLRRLDAAFLMSACVLSDDQTVAFNVAKTIEATVNEEPSFERPIGGDELLYSRARLIELDDNQLEKYRDDYWNLRFPKLPSAFLEKYLREFEKGYVPGNRNLAVNDAVEHARKQLERMRYLTDARGAATLFRLPVSVNSGAPGMDVRQRAPDYTPAKRHMTKDVPKGEILLGAFETSGQATLPLADFRRHVLITGFTGGGKTQAVLHLLHQFWNNENVPFLVIEAAKKEYRGLLTVESWREQEKLRVFTLGNSSGVPFRLNPFELLEGTRVELHISRLATCFEASFPKLPFLTSILVEALGNVYRDFGWNLNDCGVAPSENPVYPTLKYFVDEVDRIASERGYKGESEANVRAAIHGRLKILLLGSVGDMLNCQKSTDLERLFNSPTILELNDLNEQTKSITTMFLLVFLREYRELHPNIDGLGHVTVVEEAHNILERTGHADEEISSDSKAQAVSAFCNMLAELRSYGEGLIIADQSPNKLAPDAMRNTNVQIAFQLRDANDRNAVANAMIMSEEQRDYIAKLRPGAAAVFYTGLERATFLKFPQYYEAKCGDKTTEKTSQTFLGQGFRTIDDDELRKLQNAENQKTVKPFYPDCVLCPWRGDDRCRHRQIAAFVADLLNKSGDDLDDLKRMIEQHAQTPSGKKNEKTGEEERALLAKGVACKVVNRLKEYQPRDEKSRTISVYQWSGGYCMAVHCFHILAKAQIPQDFVNVLFEEYKKAFGEH